MIFFGENADRKYFFMGENLNSKWGKMGIHHFYFKLMKFFKENIPNARKRRKETRLLSTLPPLTKTLEREVLLEMQKGNSITIRNYIFYT